MNINNKPRTKPQIEDSVTMNYLLLADFVVRKTGPIPSYQKFAELTGVGSNLSEIRTGKRKVPFIAAVLACEIFGCSSEWMFMNKGEMYGKEDLARRVSDLEDRLDKVERKVFIKQSK
jgi:hypothetical protein